MKPEESLVDKQRQMMALRDRIAREDPCPELRLGATNLVMGEGSLDARIVIIGEAPGKNEDIIGKPFVGASGKFLDEMLRSVGLKRENIYITNIVKYRPPNNRDPLPAEKRAFWPYLVEQLRIIHPAVIVTLGRHSMEYILPDQRISEAHGVYSYVTLEGESYRVLPLYHPAAAIYNRSLRQTLLDDFRQLRDIIPVK